MQLQCILMEVAIQIVQARVGDAQRFKLRCKVQATGQGSARETHEGSVAVAQPTTDKPEFTFTFASKPAHISILFAATSSRQESTSYLEKELGTCEATFSATAPQHTKTLLLRRQIPETNLEKFAGKLTFAVSLREAFGTDYTSLLADETKRSCEHVLPSESPFVSVVFHWATTWTDPTNQLVGIARIGDRSDISIDTLVHAQGSGGQSPQQLHHVPLLKPVRLSCREFDCLELHIADKTSGHVLFSASQIINRLFPFRPIHYNYDSHSAPNTTHGGGESGSRGLSVSVSVIYTPSLAEFSQFEGLEVVVYDTSLPSGVRRCTDVVIGVQLLHRDSKMKIPALNNHSLQPPFQLQAKKGRAAVSAPDYHVTVLQFLGRELNASSSAKAYFLFPYSSSPNKLRDAVLVFHVYGSSGSQLWWNTDNCTSAQLEINKQTITSLQAGGVASIPWNVKSEDSSQPCLISGVMRWKSKKMPFFTESSIRALAMAEQPPVAEKTPPTYSIRTENASDNDHQTLKKQLLTEQFDPASLQQTLEGLVTPTEDVHSGEGEAGDTNVLSQLTEFESNLRHMATDFRILRRENQRLQADNEQLLLQMAKLRSVVTVSPQTQGSLQQLSTSDLVLRVCSLQRNLEAEEKEHERCRKKCQTLQSDLCVMQDLEGRYLELQDAHTAQQKLVQFLRGKVAKYYKCSDVCRNQESVITQLESLLVKQAQGTPSSKDDALTLLSKENAELRAMLQQYQITGDRDGQTHAASLLEKDRAIHSLKSQLSQLVSRCQHLEHERTECGAAQLEGGREVVDTRAFELEQKLLVADAKLSAQTSQLQENAGKWMMEKAHYELQLADFRSRLDTVIRSGQKALLSTHTDPAASPTAEQSTSEPQCREGDHVQRYFSGKTNTKDFSF